MHTHAPLSVSLDSHGHAAMLGGGANGPAPGVCGTMTSGGTESILMAMKARGGGVYLPGTLSSTLPAPASEGQDSEDKYTQAVLLLSNICPVFPHRYTIALSMSPLHLSLYHAPVPLPSLQASRDYVRATRGVRRPEMILAKSAHAAYWKVDRGSYDEGQCDYDLDSRRGR